MFNATALDPNNSFLPYLPKSKGNLKHNPTGPQEITENKVINTVG